MTQALYAHMNKKIFRLILHTLKFKETKLDEEELLMRW
jgi:hypothetical protein